jgi:hypothetical protein
MRKKMRYSPKISLRTETILRLIANNLSKQNHTVTHEGMTWTKISRRLMAKICKCTVETISHHVGVLTKENVLLSRPIDSLKGDRTNFYTINPSALANERLASIFSSPIVKKIVDINRKNKSINKSLINLDDEKNLARKKTYPGSKCITITSPVHKPITTTARDMLRIYNEELDRNEKMTQPKAQFLVAAYNSKFKSLEAWRGFIRAIKKSWYLIKSGFQWCLDWLLRFKVLDRILSGGFGVRFEESPPETPLPRDPEEHISSLNEDMECLELRRRFVKRHGRKSYWSHMIDVSLKKTMARYHGRNEKILLLSSHSNYRVHAAVSLLDSGDILGDFYMVDSRNFYNLNERSQGCMKGVCYA